MTAPDAGTDLRAALDAHDRKPGSSRYCVCGWFAGWEGTSFEAVDRWADHREQAVRAALAAHPIAPSAPAEGLIPDALTAALLDAGAYIGVANRASHVQALVETALAALAQRTAAEADAGSEA